MARDPLADLYVNETLAGRYEVLEFVASGGFCLVFRARDHQENEDVAIKILKPSALGDAAIEFETEGILLERLQKCSGVLTLLSAATNTDQIMVHKAGMPTPFPLPVQFLVVELADACVADVVVNRSAVTFEERLGLFRDLVLGVHQMHLQGIVHRDMKAENGLVFVGPAGDTRAVVADLGRGRDTKQPARFLADAYLAGRGDIRFAPPELLHLLGTEDSASFRRADVFLLGSALYELVTGQGITSLAYGDPRAVLVRAMRTDPSRRSAEYFARLSDTRALYRVAIEIAALECPRSVRHEGVRLLQQLCDPDPRLRERRVRAEVHQHPWGLEWLLRRVDILLKLERLHRRGYRRTYRRV